MHEEWADARRTAEVRVQLTGADEVRVIKDGYGHYYRPFAFTAVACWPGDKIGHGSVSFVLLANEVQFSGELSPNSVSLLLSDLDEVPPWLASLAQAAQARCYG